MVLESDKGQLAARLELEQQERQVLTEAEERRRNEERKRLAAEAKAAAEVIAHLNAQLIVPLMVSDDF